MSKKNNTAHKFGNDDALSDAIYKLIPKSKNQKIFMESIVKNHITFGTGAAGTGKTFIATVMASQALQFGTASKIIICRPIVEAGGEKLGFLPGDLQEKCDPYLKPITDVFDFYWRGKRGGGYHWLLQNGLVEIAPLAYMRGRSFSGAWIICDEAQNMTALNMRMLVTRFGNDCKMIITGDPSQKDKRDANGLERARDKLQDVEGIGFVNFGNEDVVRHKLVQDILADWPEDQ